MSVLLYWKSLRKIVHTLAQNRRYLKYAAAGVGTLCLSQCHKLHSKSRSFPTSENKTKQQTSTEEDTFLEKSSLSKNTKTKLGLKRKVENMIQESKSKGELRDPSGHGKSFPAVWDSGIHKSHEVFDDSGFTPEWIISLKEIREDLKQLRGNLSAERSQLGPYPLSSEEVAEWQSIISKYEKLTEQINKKIAKFNLIVPFMDKQMIRVDLNKEAHKILINGLHSQYKFSSRTDALGNVLSFFEDILFGRWKKYM